MEAKEQGKSSSPPEPDEPTTDPPIWDEIDAAMRALPDAVLDSLPSDMAEQHDHYLYGTPKR